MDGPKSRKRSDLLLDLEKRIEAGVRKEKRLERYHRLLREGRRKEAMIYMRKHNMLDEVMDMSHVVRLEDLEQVGSPPKKGSPLGSRGKVGIHAEDIELEVVDLDKYGSPPGSRRKSVQPAEDLELEVVDLDPYGSPQGSRGKSGQPAEDSGLEVVEFEPYGSSSKKRSSSGSRKRSSGKSSDSRSRKQGLSFGKMAKALEIQANQDAVFRPIFFNSNKKMDPHTVLGVPPNSSIDVIKKQYRKKEFEPFLLLFDSTKKNKFQLEFTPKQLKGIH
jgi:hypothetical protein